MYSADFDFHVLTAAEEAAAGGAGPTKLVDASDAQGIFTTSLAPDGAYLTVPMSSLLRVSYESHGTPIIIQITGAGVFTPASPEILLIRNRLYKLVSHQAFSVRPENGSATFSDSHDLHVHKPGEGPNGVPLSIVAGAHAERLFTTDATADGARLVVRPEGLTSVSYVANQSRIWVEVVGVSSLIGTQALLMRHRRYRLRGSQTYKVGTADQTFSALPDLETKADGSIAIVDGAIAQSQFKTTPGSPVLEAKVTNLRISSGGYTGAVCIKGNVCDPPGTGLNQPVLPNRRYIIQPSEQAVDVDANGNCTERTLVPTTLVVSCGGTAVAPAAPSNVQATLVEWLGNSGHVHVTWNDNSSNETGFSIERRFNNEFFSLAGTVSPNTGGAQGGFVDLVTPGTYTYRVRAFNGELQSEYSATATVDANPVAKPVLAATLVSGTRIDVSWTPLAHATSATLYRGVDGGALIPLATPAVSDTSFSDPTVSVGHSYTYVIENGNIQGTSSSDPVSITIDVPAAPTGLYATVPTRTSATIHWSFIPASEVGFKVLRSIGAGAFATIATLPDRTARSFTDTGRVEGESLRYQVRAYNGAGDGALSAIAPDPALVMTTPASPTALTATLLSPSQVELRWTDASNNENGFIVRRRTGTAAAVPLTTTGPGVTQFLDITAAAGAQYTYEVLATNAFGDSDPPATAGATLLTPVSPGAFTARVMGPTRVDLTWMDVPNETRYRLSRAIDGTNFLTHWEFPAGATTFSDTSVMNGETYTYLLVAENNLGPSSPPASLVIPVKPPARPESFTGRNISRTQTDLAWTVAPDSTHNGFLLRRKLATEGDDRFTPITSPGEAVRAYSDSGLPENTSFTYRLSAVNGAGESSIDLTISTGKPAAPTNLVAKVASSTQVNLTWVDNANSEGGYRVQRSSNGTVWATLPPTNLPFLPANSTSYSATGLNPGTRYYFRVYATNATETNNSDYSNTEETRMVVPSPAPTNLVATAISPSQIRLTWLETMVSENGFEVQHEDAPGQWTKIGESERNVRQFDHLGLAPGSTHKYRVRGFNGISPPSGFSNEASATTSISCVGAADGTPCSNPSFCSPTCQAGVCTGAPLSSCAAADIEPLLTCVLSRGATAYTAIFGYRNGRETNSYVPPSAASNAVTPGAVDQGQPHWFKARTAQDPTQPLAFSVDFDASVQAPPSWKVGARTVTASAAPTGSCALDENGDDGITVSVGSGADLRTRVIAYDRGKIARATTLDPDVVAGDTLKTPGGLTGSVDVTNDGAATYRVPIEVLPGRAGLQPELSLNYHSRRGNGLVGVGWELGGLSQIAVCRANLRQDAELRPVTFTADDALCLDGQRLIRVEGAGATLRQAGEVEYRLEHDRGLRVLARQIVNGVPTWFEAYARSGRILRFGVHPRYPGGTSDPGKNLGRARRYERDAEGVGMPVADRPLVLWSWPITEIRDRYENLVEVSYEVVSGEIYDDRPYEIRYTGRPGEPGYRAVRFLYEDRTAGFDQVERGFAGIETKMYKRLGRIEIRGPRMAISGGRPARVGEEVATYYSIRYQQSPVSRRSLVSSIAQCEPGVNGDIASDEDICKRPIEFKWDEGDKDPTLPVAGSFIEKATSITDVMEGDGATSYSSLHIGDLNGDGRDDIIYNTRPAGGTQAKMVYRLAQTALQPAFGPALNLPVTGSYESSFSIADIDADGRQDILRGREIWMNRGGNPLVFERSPFSATEDSRLVDVDGDRILEIAYTGPDWPRRWEESLLACLNQEPGCGEMRRWHYSRLVGGQGTQAGRLGPTSRDGRKYAVAFMDLDGDGRTDAIDDWSPGIVDSAGRPDENADEGWTYSPAPGGGADFIKRFRYGLDDGFDAIPLDLNGDGLADWQTAVNNGNGFRASGRSVLNQVVRRDSLLFDFNFDSRTDVLSPRATPADPFLKITLLTPETETEAPTGVPWGHFATGKVGWKSARVCRDVETGEVLSDPSSPRIYCPAGAGNFCYHYPPSGEDPTKIECTCPPGGETFTSLGCAKPPTETDFVDYRTTKLMDWNGDGLTDIVLVKRVGQPVVPGTLSVWVRNGKKPDVLKMVTDGNGATSSLTFQPIVDHSSAKTPGGCGHPFDCTNRGMWLATSLTVDTGTPSAITQAYSYHDGRSDLLGRGWLGFRKREMKRFIGGLGAEGALLDTTTTEYDKAFVEEGGLFPYRNRVTREIFTKTSPSLSAAREVVTHFPPPVRGVAGADSSQNGGIYRLDPESVTTRQYEDGDGNALDAPFKSERVSTATIDRFGNTTAESSTVSWRYSRVGALQTAGSRTVRTFDSPAGGDPNDFVESAFLGLVKRTEEYSIYPGSAEEGPRTQDFGYDVSRATMRTRTIQLGGGVDQQLTVSYTPDPTYGIVTKTDSADLRGEVRTTEVRLDPVEHMFPEQTINALGHQTTTVFHPLFGVPLLIADANGRVVRNKYDRFGRPRGTDGPLEADTSINYSEDSANKLIVTTTSSAGSAARQGFDRLGRETMKATRAFDGTWTTSTTKYDSLGRVEQVSGAYGTTSFTYDQLDRQKTSTSLDEEGRPASVEWSYPSFFRTEKTDQTKRFKSSVTVDGLGNTVENGQVFQGVWLNTNFAYRPFGLLWQSTTGPAGDRLTTTIDYDDLGRKKSLATPDTGTTTWTYTAFGEAERETDNAGRVTVVAYDRLGRPQSRRFGTSLASPANTYTYDSSPSGIGQPATVNSSDGVVQRFEYDPVFGGTAAAEMVVPGENGGLPLRQSQTYDPLGRVDTLTYPLASSQPGAAAVTIKYGYRDVDGSLEVINRVGAGAGLIWQTQGRDPLGRITWEDFGGGARTLRAFHPNTGRLTGISSTGSGGESLQSLEYKYDPNSLLRVRRDWNNGLHELFGYDELGRLAGWGEIEPSTETARAGGFGMQFGYDGHGNLRSRTLIGGPTGGQTVSYTHDRTDNAGPHAVTSSTLWPDRARYDLAGNMESHPQAGDIRYTPFNLPRRIENGPVTVDYLYDAANTRVLKTSGGLKTLYFGNYERRSGDDSHVFYVSNGERTIAQIVRNDATGAEQTSYMFADHIGSVDVVQGAGVRTIKRDPFGNRITKVGSQWDVSLSGGLPSAPDTLGVTRGFTGHEQEDEIGFVNMNGRIFDSRLGHFMQADPLVSMPNHVNGHNRYAYVLNNPLAYTDPSGFELTRQQQCEIDPICAEGFEPPPTEPEHGNHWLYEDMMEFNAFDAQIAAWERAQSQGGNPAGAVIDPATGKPVLLAQDMTFDGKTLKLFEPQTMTDAYMTRNRPLLGQWPAVSGREGFQSPASQSLRDKGPIPAGDYLARRSNLQSRLDTSLLDRAAGVIGRGGWPGGARAWGDYRLWLEPTSGTNTYGRSGFSIHGGSSPGSAGCIDLCGGMNSFVQQYRLLDRDLTLRVQY